MNRCRFGAGLLIGLLILGIFSSFWTSRRYGSLSREMDRAEELALQQDLDGAADAVRQCRGSWNRCRALTAALADHERLDRIDTLFRQLDSALGQEDFRSAASLCARIARDLEAMAGEHSLSWENIL